MVSTSSKISFVLVCLTLFLLHACSTKEKEPLHNPTQIEKYFPLGKFIEDQIDLLDGAEVTKVIAIKGREESVSTILDGDAWRKELDLFIQADINKNSLATSYATEDSPHLLRHTLLPGEKGDIKMISIHRSDSQIRKIEFTFRRENFFYLSEGSGSLFMTADGNHISSYQVSGLQKVWFMPPNIMTASVDISNRF
jgi:hypothetical protein